MLELKKKVKSALSHKKNPVLLNKKEDVKDIKKPLKVEDKSPKNMKKRAY